MRRVDKPILGIDELCNMSNLLFVHENIWLNYKFISIVWFYHFVYQWISYWAWTHSNECTVRVISPSQTQARSENFRAFSTPVERDIAIWTKAHQHHQASRSYFVTAACSSHHTALLPCIRHQKKIACTCFIFFLIIFSLLKILWIHLWTPWEDPRGKESPWPLEGQWNSKFSQT